MLYKRVNHVLCSADSMHLRQFEPAHKPGLPDASRCVCCSLAASAPIPTCLSQYIFKLLCSVQDLRSNEGEQPAAHMRAHAGARTHMQRRSSNQGTHATHEVSSPHVTPSATYLSPSRLSSTTASTRDASALFIPGQSQGMPLSLPGPLAEWLIGFSLFLRLCRGTGV